MKRTIITFVTLILCVCMVFALSACGGFTQEDIDNAVNEATAPLKEQISVLEADKVKLEADKAELEAKNENIENCINGKHSGGTATCTEKAICDNCNSTYGKNNPDNHIYEDGICVYSLIDATEMTKEQLNTAVAQTLANGHTDIEITMVSEPEIEMFTAIRRAICDTEGVNDASINLTLKGVTTIPDATSNCGEIFGVYEGGYIESETDEWEIVTQLATVNLPDVTYIGDYAFESCNNLTTVIAPKAITIGEESFFCTKLSSISLPELTTIGMMAFYGCRSLTEVDFPKVITIEHGEFKDCSSLTMISFPNLEILSMQIFSKCQALSEVSLPKVTSIGDLAFDGNTSLSKLILTAEGDIIMNYDSTQPSYMNDPFQNISTTNIALVLNRNKQSQVEGNTWTTKDVNGIDVSYTFKSIEFTCSDGTTKHTYEGVTNNGNSTHTFACTTCNSTIAEGCRGGEATCKELAICQICEMEYGKLADHILTPETGYCKSGCGELVAVAKVTLGEVTTYYATIKDVREEKQNGATITLLKNVTTGYLQWGKCDFTFDLNGFTFDKGGYELYVSDGGEEVVSLINTSETRAGINSVLVSTDATFTIEKNVDIKAILIGGRPEDVLIDISSADFTSTTIKVNADGFNTSQIVLGGYAVYDDSGNVITGELTKNVIYTIKVAE